MNESMNQSQKAIQDAIGKIEQEVDGIWEEHQREVGRDLATSLKDWLKSVQAIEGEVTGLVDSKDDEARSAAALRTLTTAAVAESGLSAIAGVQTFGPSASTVTALGSGVLSGLIGRLQQMFKSIWSHIWNLISHLTKVKEWSVKFTASMGFLPGGGGEIELKFG